MRIIDLRGQNLSRAELLAAMPRAAMGTSEATDLVRPILDDVKERGAAALRDFEEKFDHVRPKNLRVPVEAIKDALTTLDPEVRAAIEESVRRARAVAANKGAEGLLHRPRRRRPRGRTLDSDSARRPVCARRQGRLPELRHHERGPGTGRRRGIPRHRNPAEP